MAAVNRLSLQNSNPRSSSSSENSNKSIPAARKSLATESAVKRRTSNMSNKDKEPSETNISVYVRCRSRNDREIKESSGVVVSTLGHKGKEVILQTGPMAVSNKTYTFDRVFGAESDQEVVFDGIARNLLSEVLEGFNCTVFAYGQTGTGKTYTMSGDIKTSSNGLLNEDAGIIPRTLVALFKELDELPDFSVKISFIELYNEELRDLLTHDPSLDRKVKIFDDATKKSIIVQGMEEIYIKTAKEGLELLNEGSFKRQVASTQCNDLSSRSHTVFTITVHMKRIDPITGEEILKIGKLNLVDLAGSENISRSGAENKRAREAGMINQSLLTLGRVINALVDQSPHIPYRESKLTRLLQDSLGGKTKTCLIATISPAKVSLDETLSTLEYANRAKNIKNKPQANSTMSKQMMIKEYIEEIERLRTDLNATRSKNGVYITEENLNQLTQESESRRIQIEEQRLRIELLDDQIKKFKSNFEAQLEQFAKNEKKLQETEIELEKTSETLNSTKNILNITEHKLQDEIAIRQEHEQTEIQLKNIGQQLVGLLDSIVSAKSELHQIIEMREKNEGKNFENHNITNASIERVQNNLSTSIVEFSSENEKLTHFLNEGFDKVIKNEQDKLSSKISVIGDITDNFTNKIDLIINEVTGNSSIMADRITDINLVKKQVKDEVSEELINLKNQSGSFFGEMMLNITDLKSSVASSYKDLGNQFSSLINIVQQQLGYQEEEIKSLKSSLMKHSSKSEELLLIEQNRIAEFMKAETEKIEEEEKELLSNITSMIQGFSRTKKRRLDDKFNELTGSLDHISKKSNSFTSKFDQATNKWVSSQGKFMSLLTDERLRMSDEIIEKEKLSSGFLNDFHKNVETEKIEYDGSMLKAVVELDDKMSHLTSFSKDLKQTNSKNLEITTNLISDINNIAVNSFNEISDDMNGYKENLTMIKPEIIEVYNERQTSSFKIHESSIQGAASDLQNIIKNSNFVRDDTITPPQISYNYTKVFPSSRDHKDIILARITEEAEQPKENLDLMEIDSSDKENERVPTGKVSKPPTPTPVPDQRLRHKKSLSRSASVLSQR